MDRSTARPDKLFAVHLPSAGCWMAISSEAVAQALEETYEVVEYSGLDFAKLREVAEDRGAILAAIDGFGPIAEGREAGMQRAIRAFLAYAKDHHA